nr:hypothetical protein BDOA9_0205320 [Bradyrhizobium sp. DOA9]
MESACRRPCQPLRDAIATAALDGSRCQLQLASAHVRHHPFQRADPSGHCRGRLSARPERGCTVEIAPCWIDRTDQTKLAAFRFSMSEYSSSMLAKFSFVGQFHLNAD